MTLLILDTSKQLVVRLSHPQTAVSPLLLICQGGSHQIPLKRQNSPFQVSASKMAHTICLPMVQILVNTMMAVGLKVNI